jgi:hypothetical protein
MTIDDEQHRTIILKLLARASFPEWEHSPDVIAELRQAVLDAKIPRVAPGERVDLETRLKRS